MVAPQAHLSSMKNLELSEVEAEALVRELAEIVDGDRRADPIISTIMAGDRAMKPIILALALIAAAPIATNAQTTEPREPRSCQRFHEEMSKCEIGMRSCDQHVIARLQVRCQRDVKRLPQVLEPHDGGRP
jgi:hypothetical protein